MGRLHVFYQPMHEVKDLCVKRELDAEEVELI